MNIVWIEVHSRRSKILFLANPRLGRGRAEAGCPLKGKVDSCAFLQIGKTVTCLSRSCFALREKMRRISYSKHAMDRAIEPFLAIVAVPRISKLRVSTPRRVRLSQPAPYNSRMTRILRYGRKVVLPLFVAASVCLALAYQASSIPSAQRINPVDLAKALQSSDVEKPLIIQVGSHVLYSQAHIPGSEYIGPAAGSNGLEQLRKRVASLPKNKYIVLYCGCCPWDHCPNIKPADDALHAMGFSNVKVLYITNNFGADWVDKGYPVTKGD